MTDPFLEKYPHRAAVIDLGSNSLKIVCYAADHTGEYSPYRRESVRIRLDEYDDGLIRDGPLAKATDTLMMFRNIIQHDGIHKVMAVATSAMRGARNRADVIRRLRQDTGFEFRVLSGNEEALYSYVGAATRLDVPNTIFFDIGGGSVELVSVRNHTVMYADSLPLGALVMTRKFVGNDDLKGDAIGALRAHVRNVLPPLQDMKAHPDDTILVGVGGAARALARYAQSYASYPIRKTHNYEMDSQLVHHVVTEILYQSIWALGRMYEIGGGRADIMKAGAVVVEEIMDRYGMDGVRVSASGLREGVLSVAVWRPTWGHAEISPHDVRDLVRTPSWIPHVPEAAADVVRAATGLLSAEESTVLQAAAANLGWLRTFRDADDFLYRLLDWTSALSHRTQLLSALCLTYAKKAKRTKLLMKRYDSMLRPGDDVMVKRLSAIMLFCDSLITSGAVAHATLDDGRLLLNVREHRGAIPKSVLKHRLRRMEKSLGVQVVLCSNPVA